MVDAFVRSVGNPARTMQSAADRTGAEHSPPSYVPSGRPIYAATERVRSCSSALRTHAASADGLPAIKTIFNLLFSALIKKVNLLFCPVNSPGSIGTSTEYLCMPSCSGINESGTEYSCDPGPSGCMCRSITIPFSSLRRISALSFLNPEL